MRQLQYDDFLVEMASTIEERGLRAVLRDFESCYPEHYRQLVQMVTHKEQQVAALFKPPPPNAVSG